MAIVLADSSIKDNYTQSITTPLSKSMHVYVSSVLVLSFFCVYYNIINAEFEGVLCFAGGHASSL